MNLGQPWMRSARIIVVLTAMVLPGCGGSGGDPPARSAAESLPVPATGAELPGPHAAGTPSVVFLGTSLTAGLGLDPDSAYPAWIQRKVDAAGLGYTVVNAGQSGESSAGALTRIDWIMRQRPAVLVIETGANDGLRGQDPDSTRANIQAIIDRARAASPATRIVLAAMEAMPNLGQDYVRRFRAIFPGLAKRNDITLLPFILDGVAGIDSLNQQDGIHPGNRGARLVADNVWRGLEPVLRAAREQADGRLAAWSTP
ncbi:MAG: arylesterase [Gemmatimonadetes bacterium]|nr:arylesterase [Gemmatimonadota bacterium]